MINSDIAAPVYTFEPVTTISLFGEISVPKAYYDLVWSMAVRHISKMGPYRDVSIGDVLDVGIHPFLSEKGLDVAEQCLDHFAATKMLPLTAVDKSCGRTFYLVD